MQLVRHVDELGRVVLPQEMRNQLNLHNRDAVCITLEESKVVIQKATKHCYLCGASETLADIGGISLCVDCRSVVGNLQNGDQTPIRT